MIKRNLIVLTAFLLLCGVSANAQKKGDLNGDGKVDAADVVELVGLVMNPEESQGTTPSETGSIKVNVKIENKSSNDITLSPRVTFVLGSEETSFETKSGSLFSNSTVVTIKSGGYQEFNNVEIPEGKKHEGLHFATKAQLEAKAHPNPSNSVLYDANSGSLTYIPDMLDSSEAFEDGGSYTIVVSKSEASSSSTPAVNPSEYRDVKLNFTIKNGTSKPVTIWSALKLVLSTKGTQWEGKYAYLRVGNIYLNGRDTEAQKSSTITIASGETKTFNNIVVYEGDEVGSQQYIGCHFANKNELKKSDGTYFAGNILLYDPNDGFSSENFVCDMIDPSKTFADGATYNIVISKVNTSSSSTPSVNPTPSSGYRDVTMNFVIKNQSPRAITIWSGIKLVLSTKGTKWEGIYPYLRVGAIYLNGRDSEAQKLSTITIRSGETKTFNNIVVYEGDKVGSQQYIGYHFANSAEIRPKFANNILLYDPNDGFNSESIVPDMIDPSQTFQDKATYTITYR